MKRTTLILEEGCMDRLRDLARRQGRTMSEIVNELLAEGLRKRRPKQDVPPLPTFDMGQPRVDLADREALEAVMED
jgi:macrodomain Ter protein organizer (MatP/YcbG family)